MTTDCHTGTQGGGVVAGDTALTDKTLRVLVVEDRPLPRDGLRVLPDDEPMI